MRDVDPVEVGKRLRARRLALGLTQVALAQRITLAKGPGGRAGDVSSSRISEWEAGKAMPTQLLSAVCSALDESPTWLLHGVRDTPDQERVVDYEALLKLFDDDDLKHLEPRKIGHLARLLEGTEAGPEAARAALLLLFPRPRHPER